MAKERRRLARGGLHRVERAKRQQKILVTSAIVVVSLVLILVVGGAIYDTFIRPPQPIATVAGEVITTREFQARVKYERAQWVARYSQTYQAIQFYQDNQELLTQIYTQLNQIAGVLEPTSMGERILNQMIEERLIRQEANRQGIFVSEAEIDAALLEGFQFYPEGTPTLEPTLTPQLTSTLSATQFSLLTPTPTETIAPTTSVTPTATYAPEMLATSGIFTSTPTNTALPDTPTREAESTIGAPAVTPTIYTTELAGQDILDYLQQIADTTNDDFTEADLRAIFEFDLYREKMLGTVEAEIAREPLQVWVRHILIEDEETASEVLERLDAGDSWADMVLEYSLNPTTALNGGDLGWFTDQPQEPDYPQAFMDAAFALAIGEISQPIETPSGWHIIQILGKENRQLSETQYNQVVQQAFLDLVEVLREAAEIDYADYWMSRIPNEPGVPANLGGGLIGS